MKQFQILDLSTDIKLFPDTLIEEIKPVVMEKWELIIGIYQN